MYLCILLICIFIFIPFHSHLQHHDKIRCYILKVHLKLFRLSPTCSIFFWEPSRRQNRKFFKAVIGLHAIHDTSWLMTLHSHKIFLLRCICFFPWLISFLCRFSSFLRVKNVSRHLIKHGLEYVGKLFMHYVIVLLSLESFKYILVDIKSKFCLYTNMCKKERYYIGSFLILRNLNFKIWIPSSGPRWVRETPQQR